MEEITEQIRTWKGTFGKEYTDRNELSVEEYEEMTKTKSGFTQSQLIKEFLGDLEVSNLLEIGSNVGLQLIILEKNGFRNLYGMEIQEYAINKSKTLTLGKDIYIIKGSALDIPYRSRHFDLVFTAGLLIHISPNEINTVMDEIYRCSRKYIWGHEYYSDSYETISYREKPDLLWKTNFAKLFLERFTDLRLVKEKIYKEGGQEHKKYSIYLLEKIT